MSDKSPESLICCNRILVVGNSKGSRPFLGCLLPPSGSADGKAKLSEREVEE